MKARILVMGATGEVGGRVLRGLRERGEAAMGASREPARAASRTGGVWVELDLDRSQTLGPALEGVDRLFMVMRPGDDAPDLSAAPLLDAARATGVSRVVSLTAIGVDAEPEFGLRRVELLAEASGLEFTHLRPNFFMQIFAAPPLLPGILATGALRLPAGDARLSYVDTRDIAEVAVASLTGEGHGGQAWTLTGPESLNHYDVARHLSEASGTDIRYEALTEKEASAQMANAGLSPARVQRLLGFYRRVRAGLAAPVHNDIERLLGRPPRSFASFAADWANSCASAGTRRPVTARQARWPGQPDRRGQRLTKIDGAPCSSSPGAANPEGNPVVLHDGRLEFPVVDREACPGKALLLGLDSQCRLYTQCPADRKICRYQSSSQEDRGNDDQGPRPLVCHSVPEDRHRHQAPQDHTCQKLESGPSEDTSQDLSGAGTHGDADGDFPGSPRHGEGHEGVDPRHR